MLLRRITKISQLLALTAIIFGVGAFYQTNGASAFDDDKKGKKQDRRGDQGKRGGQDKREDRGDRGNRGRDPQRDSDRESRRQQEQSDRNSRNQQRQSDQNSRRQQESSDWNSQRQQWESDRRSRQQQAESDRRSRQQDNWGNGRSGGGRRIIEDNDRDRNDRRRNDDRRVVYGNPRGYLGPPWNQRPQFRVDNRRFIQDQQRFLKEQSKAQRRYQQDQQRMARNTYGSYSAPVYGYDNNYYANQSDYDRGTSWRGQILPMLIANIFGGGSNSYNTGFPQDRYARTNVDPYAYQYRQPAYAPAYTYGPTYDNSYNNYGYDDPYSYNQQGFDTGSVLSSLPIAEIISQYTGENEFVSGLIGTFLSQGYDQGLMAGQNARQYGYTDEQYNDPYTYQNGAFDPYSVSMGENRRYLSEGYEQGYRDGYSDAQASNQYYDQANAGSSDLIGVLLNNVLSGV
ncbi:MAG: hypothetical protein IPG58_14805 [Acidobacteria bacterium]|nr:hypothetical protein [Acidobacteriota bacterium]